jgi:hypothetical protein
MIPTTRLRPSSTSALYHVRLLFAINLSPLDDRLISLLVCLLFSYLSVCCLIVFLSIEGCI